MFRPAALVPCLLSGLLLASGAGADDAALKTVRIERIYVQVATGLFVERSFAAARRVAGHFGRQVVDGCLRFRGGCQE